MITLITATGERPEAFKLCTEYVARQTYKGPMQWIVVDDGKVPIPTPRDSLKFEYIRGPKIWKPGINTQRLNLDIAIPHIKGDHILLIEDDDWYSPHYLECMLSLLQNADVVGEADAKYYNIKDRSYNELKNYTHASLCSTAFNKKVLPLFELAVNSGELYIDSVFWNLVKQKRAPYTLRLGTANLCVGMKGLPGRKGIGIGHTPVGYSRDTDTFDKLREWIGGDVSLYKQWLK